MSRRVTVGGEVIVSQLKDLKKGDKVCVSHNGGRYINTTVTRVRTVECATIITVEKVRDFPERHFVGYYTSKIAIADYDVVLTLDTYWADAVEGSLQNAEDRSMVIITRAKALKAMIDLKTWLFSKEDKFRDKDPE